MTKKSKPNNVMKPQEGRQQQFVSIKTDGLSEEGLAYGKGDEIDFIFYGGGGGGC